MSINIEVFLSKSWRTASLQNLGHRLWNEYQHIWQFIGTIEFEFAARWICTCAHYDGFPYSIWLTCLVIKLYCKSFDHNSVCVRASICELSDVRTFGCLCDLYNTRYEYECVCQHRRQRQQQHSRTTSSRTVCLCVQSKWNRDSDGEREKESEWRDERMVVSKENISNAKNQLYLWAWIVKVIHRWTFLYFARCHLSTSIKIHLADSFPFFLFFSPSRSLSASLSIQNRLIQLIVRLCFNF